MKHFAADRLWATGNRMAEGLGHDVDAAGIVWLLTKDAAKTISTFPSPMPSGYPSKSCWPEHLTDNFFAVLRERASDNIDGEVARIQHIPDAAAIDRSEVIWDYWRGCLRLGNRIKLVRAIWDNARGMRPAKVRETYGVSRTRLYAARKDGCEAIARRLGWI